MSSSSVDLVLNKGNALNRLKTAVNSSPQAVASVNVTNRSTYSLDRYLDRDGQAIMDQQQRPPLGVERTRDGGDIEAEAEAKAKDRMLTLLHDFDEKFGSGGNSSTG